MALLTKRGRDVPEGAIVLTKEEALEHQKRLLAKWPSLSEVFFLKYANHITGIMTFISSIPAFMYYQRTFNVGKHWSGFIIGTFILPTALTASTTEYILTNQTLLMKLNCPLCNQLKFAVVEYYSGILLPIAYGSALYSTIGVYTGKYNMEFGNDARKFWIEMFKILRGGSRAYKIAGIIQTIVILGLPFLQNKQFFRVIDKVKKESNMDFSEE